ncbi:MAG: DUF2442 domain-containing protein [Chloroflexota bacterium]
MRRVIQAQPFPDFSIELEFSDGFTKRVNILPFIRDGISVPLRDWNYFQQVAIDDGGGITWPNGYDFCPEFLREHVEAMPGMALPVV